MPGTVSEGTGVRFGRLEQWARGGVMFGLALALAACASTPAGLPTNLPPNLIPGLPQPTSAAPEALHILSRGDQLDPQLYDAFTSETGITVVEESYQVDDQLVDMLGSASDADLVVASDQVIPRLDAAGRLQHLNANTLKNFRLVDGRLKGPAFDPNNFLSAPAIWGTVGILYRTDQGALAPDSWQAALDEAKRTPANGIALLDDPRVGLGTALKALGLSLNSRNPAEIQRAGDWLLARRAQINRFDSAAWSDALVTGEVAMAQAYSNDAAFTQDSNAHLRYVIPREGAPLWMDSFVLPATSQHPDAAAAFVDFMLRPENAALTAGYAWALPPEPGAYTKMEPARATLLRSGYIPDDATFGKLEVVADVADSQAEYERIWLGVRK